MVSNHIDRCSNSFTGTVNCIKDETLDSIFPHDHGFFSFCYACLPSTIGMVDYMNEVKHNSLTSFGDTFRFLPTHAITHEPTFGNASSFHLLCKIYNTLNSLYLLE